MALSKFDSCARENGAQRTAGTRGPPRPPGLRLTSITAAAFWIDRRRDARRSDAFPKPCSILPARVVLLASASARAAARFDARAALARARAFVIASTLAALTIGPAVWAV